jgi:hypothetical protein
VTAYDVARVAGTVVVCGSGHRCTAASRAASRRAPQYNSPADRAALTATGRMARCAGYRPWM